MHAARLPWTTLAPQQYASLRSITESLTQSTLGRRLVELIQTRVSQINGCAFCVDMHVRDARQAGEPWNRINLLSVWRETTLFSARETAALSWAESLTRLPDGYDDRKAEFEMLQASFNAQEIVELSWVIASINAWNRMAIGMHMPVADKPIE